MRLLGPEGEQTWHFRDMPGMACQGFSGPGMADSDGHYGAFSQLASRP